VKFEPGNILTHVPTKSRWIILSKKEFDWDYRAPAALYVMQFEGFCLLVGEKKKYWGVNDIETFVLTPQDLEPTDFVWRVDYTP
jgi:hypothetical protein